jgi:hypothetical protein
LFTFIWLLLRLLFLDTDGGSDDDDTADGGDGPGAGDPPGDGDDDDDNAGATKNPKKRIASLLEANTRLHKKLKERDERIEELEAGTDDGVLQEARLQAAFWRHCYTSDVKLTDAETAWELATNKGFFDTVSFSDDGEVEGMDAALTRLLERYPYLVSEEDEDEEDEPHPPISTPTSGRQPLARSKTAGVQQATTAKLRERFPALKRRV